MTTDPDPILDMIDSIEEAIAQEAPWSSRPAPPDLDPPAVPEAAFQDEVAAGLASAAIAPEIAPEIAAPIGPSAEPRKYPDAPPRSVAWIPRVHGTTAQVLATFKWGDR